MSTDDIDGRYAQGWGGAAPDGVHVNVLLARRGSPTAAAVATAFTNPDVGFTPVLATIGRTQQTYRTLYPPTVIVPKAPPVDDRHEKLIFGACAAGIARGVLDAVARELLVADPDTTVLVSLWLDSGASDGTTVCANARTATAAALAEAVDGPDLATVAAMVRDRDSVTHPFHDGS